MFLITESYSGKSRCWDPFALQTYFHSYASLIKHACLDPYLQHVSTIYAPASSNPSSMCYSLVLWKNYSQLQVKEESTRIDINLFKIKIPMIHTRIVVYVCSYWFCIWKYLWRNIYKSSREYNYIETYM